jgi:ABC-2 type transport system ATP-binding protein
MQIASRFVVTALASKPANAVTTNPQNHKFWVLVAHTKSLQCYYSLIAIPLRKFNVYRPSTPLYFRRSYLSRQQLFIIPSLPLTIFFKEDLMTPIVNVKELWKQYDPPNGVTAVKNVSFDIYNKEIFSLLGPNGAGKSTIISILSGLVTPTKGDALVGTHSVTHETDQVKLIIGVVPQEVALYNTITARENLAFWGGMHGLRGQRLQDRIKAVLEIADLADRADDKVGTFSGGMKRRINIAVALLHEPQILYMDEPTVGIDPQSRRRILDTIKELNQQGLTVLYTTHYMEEAQELSNRVGIIDHGQLIALGTMDELTKLVGQYDTISLEVGRPLLEDDVIVQELHKLPSIAQVHGEGDRIMLQTRDANGSLSHIIQCITDNNAEIKQVKIQEPNLEAIFLHLTGRTLRD